MENETGKHYVFLDSEEYTSYPDEQEVLVQAGLTARVTLVSQMSYGAEEITAFDLYISERMIKKSKIRQSLLLIIPFLLLSIYQILNYLLVLDYDEYVDDENCTKIKYLTNITLHQSVCLALFFMVLFSFVTMVY